MKESSKRRLLLQQKQEKVVVDPPTARTRIQGPEPATTRRRGLRGMMAAGSRAKKRSASCSNVGILDQPPKEDEEVKEPLAKRRRRAKNVEDEGEKEKKKETLTRRISRSGREIKPPKTLCE